MDASEFASLADETIGRLAPMIDAQQAEFVRADAKAGSWGNAPSNLVAALAKDRVPVTAQDRDDLRRLLADLGQPTEWCGPAHSGRGVNPLARNDCERSSE